MPTDSRRVIVILSTFPPRECGLATFATYVKTALRDDFGDNCEVRGIAMSREADRHIQYPDFVYRQIRQNELADYVAAAEEINRDPDVKLVYVQHEFGIFGGEFGAHLLAFTGTLTKPIVVTCHTVLPEPPPRMREVVSELARQAARLITMTETSRRLMIDVYGVEPSKLTVVSHGIMPMAYEDQTAAKAALGFAGRTTLLTFGLLSEGKGIEYVIESLPAVVSRHPEALYLIVGVTHPEIVAREGEVYRERLTARVHELGLDSHVHWHNKFVTDEKLQQFLHATDIYVATSLNPNQAVSGTLSFAMGSGRAVVSTAFAQAKEIVTDETGLLVGFQDPSAYATAINTLLDDPERRVRMGSEAFVRTRYMTWPNVGLVMMRIFAECEPEFNKVRLVTPPIKMTHLERLTDDFGILQFSVRNVPDPNSGYAVDDQARALIAAVRHFARFGDPAVLALAKVYLGFLSRAGRPSNFTGLFGVDRQPVETPSVNEDDAKGRLIMAMASVVATNGLPSDIHEPTWTLLNEWLDAEPDFKSTRAAAFLVIGLVAAVRAGAADPRLKALITHHCDHLASLYERERGDGWEWFEPCISYSNGAICEALLAGGALLGNERWLAAGRKTLDFLIGMTFLDGRYVAVGQSHWCRRGEPRSFFDQQPEDVATMVSALAARAAIDPAGPYAELQRTAFEWFLGRNTLGQFVYNVATGGCYDGLGQHAVNLNQGAESTVCYLIARLQA